MSSNPRIDEDAGLEENRPQTIQADPDPDPDPDPDTMSALLEDDDEDMEEQEQEQEQPWISAYASALRESYLKKSSTDIPYTEASKKMSSNKPSERTRTGARSALRPSSKHHPSRRPRSAASKDVYKKYKNVEDDDDDENTDKDKSENMNDEEEEGSEKQGEGTGDVVVSGNEEESGEEIAMDDNDSLPLSLTKRYDDSSRETSSVSSSAIADETEDGAPKRQGKEADTTIENSAAASESTEKMNDILQLSKYKDRYRYSETDTGRSGHVDYDSDDGDDYSAYYSYEDIDLDEYQFDYDDDLDMGEFQEESFTAGTAPNLDSGSHHSRLKKNPSSPGFSEEKKEEKKEIARSKSAPLMERLRIDMNGWFPSKTTSSATPTEISGGGLNLQEEEEEESKSFNRLDEIVHGVPAKIMKNIDAGLLGLLNVTNEQLGIDDNGNATETEGFEFYFDTSCDYLKVDDPDKKREVLSKILLGSDYGKVARGGNGNDDVQHESAYSSPDLMSLPELQFYASKEDTTEDVLDYLIELTKDKHPKVILSREKYPKEAWWIEELDDIADGMISAEDIPKLSTDKGGNGGKYSAEDNEDDAISTLSLDDDDDKGLFRTEDDLKIVLDWEERLWEAARLHHDKAYVIPKSSSFVNLGNEDTEVEEEDPTASAVYISEFRSQMINCLAIYTSIVHGYEHIMDVGRTENMPFLIDEKLKNQLSISRYVPIDVARLLFKEIVKKQMMIISKNDLKEGESDEEEKSDCRHDSQGSQVDEIRIGTRIYDVNRYVGALCEALLGGELSAFHHYEVSLVEEKEKTSQSLAYDASKQRKKISALDSTNDRRIIDEFLYGIETKEDETNANESSDVHGVKLREGEIRLCKSLKDFMMEHYVHCQGPKTIGSSTSASLNYNHLRLMPMMLQNQLESNKVSETERSMSLRQPRSEGHSENFFQSQSQFQSLSTMYASKYVVVLFLRCIIMDRSLTWDDDNEKERLGEIFKMTQEQGQQAVKQNLQLIKRILLDSSFIRRRVQIFGPSVAIRDHLLEWTALLASDTHYSSAISVDDSDVMYWTDSDRLEFLKIHNKLISELRYMIDGMKNDVSVDKLGIGAVPGVTADLDSSIDMKVENNEKVLAAVSKDMKNVYRYIEIGRSSYELGIAVGNSEKHYIHEHIEVGQDTDINSDKYTEVELADYQFAIASFRDASEILNRCKKIMEAKRGDALLDESKKLLRQSEQINEMSVSVDLYIADVLVAKGHCYDVKLRNPKRATSKYREALKLYMHLNSDHAVIINTLQNLGSTYFEMKKWEKSLRTYKDRLLLLRRVYKNEKKKKRKKNRNDNDSSLSSIPQLLREIALTCQSVGRVQTKVGEFDAATKVYEEAVTDMRKSIEYPDSILADLLEEILSELSALYLRYSSRTFVSWTEWGLKFMFCPHRNADIDGYDPNSSQFQTAMAVERKGFLCLDESIHLRLGFDTNAYLESSGNRYNGRTLRDGLELMMNDAGKNPTDLTDFLSDLMRVGILRFRQKHYRKAEVDLLAVLEVTLARGASLDTDVKVQMKRYDDDGPITTQLLENLEESDFLDDEENYALLPLLIYLGNLYIRLWNLDNSLSFFNKALAICDKRFAESINDEDDQLGIQLDLARVYQSIGFVQFLRKDYKSASSNLRSSSRLLDSVINEPSAAILNESDVFLLEMYVKISIGQVLNLLGRVFHESGEIDASAKALVCFEDSMVILDNVVEEFQRQHIHDAPQQMYSIQKIAKGAILKGTFSVASFGLSLADSYFRAGKLYKDMTLYNDAELAFHRSVRIFEDLKQDYFLQNDDEYASDYLIANDISDALLDACKSALDLAEGKIYPAYLDHDDTKDRDYVTDDSSDDEAEEEFEFEHDYLAEDDGLTFAKEDLMFRIGTCHGERKEYDLALLHLNKAKVLTAKLVGDDVIVANIAHNIGLIQRSKFLSTGYERARDDAISSFREAVEMSRYYRGQDELFYADSMFRLSEIAMFERTWHSSGDYIGIDDTELVSLLEEVLKIRLRHYEETHVEIALTRYLLGKAHYLQHNVNNALLFLSQALSTWKTIFSSFNLDIFDAIYHLGLCHRRTAIMLTDQSRRKELELVSSYFREALRHSLLFHNSVTNGLSRERDIKRTCLIHSIRCALQLLVIKEIQGKQDSNHADYKGLLSIIEHVLSTFEEYDCPQSLKLRSLIAEIWTRIGLTQFRSNMQQDAVRCFELSLDLQSSLEKDHENHGVLQNKAIASLLLARYHMHSSDSDKASELLRNTSEYLEDMGDYDSIEMAAVDVYKGYAMIEDYKHSMSHFKKILKSFQPSSESPPCGWEGLVYKFMASHHYAIGNYDLALDNILIAIPIIEDTRQKAGAHATLLPESVEEVLLLLENWDIILLECLTIGLQSAGHLFVAEDVKMYAYDFFNNVALVYAEQLETAEESFQCFYSLLLYSRKENGDDDLTIANLLFNLSNISLRSNCPIHKAACHEECFRITSQILGNNHIDLLQSTIELGKAALNLFRYKAALKWSNIGLQLLRTNDVSDDRALMELVILKAKAYMEIGDFDNAKETLERVIGAMGSFVPQVSNIHQVLGHIYQITSNFTKAYFHYCKCYKIRQECIDNKGVADVSEALAEVMTSTGRGDFAMRLCALSLRIKTSLYKTDQIEIASSLFAFAKATSNVNAKRSQDYLHEAIRMFRLHDSFTQLVPALELFGLSYESDGNVAEANDCYKEAIEIIEMSGGKPLPHLRILNRVGLTFYMMQEYKHAVKYYKQAITLAKHLHGINGTHLKGPLYWCGCALYHANDLDNALQNFRAAMRFYAKGADQEDAKYKILTMLKMGRIHVKRSEFDEANKIMDTVHTEVEYWKKSLGRKEIAEIAFLSGEILKQMNIYESAIHKFEEVMKILGPVKSWDGTFEDVHVCRELISLYCAMGNFSMARKYMHDYISSQNETHGNDSEEVNIAHEIAGDTEYLAGDLAKAMAYYSEAYNARCDAPGTKDICKLALKIAKCYAATEDWHVCLEHLSKVERMANITQDTEDVLVFVKFERASVFFAMDKNTEAMGIYFDMVKKGELGIHAENIAASFQPLLVENVRAHTNLGKYLSAHDPHEAFAHLTKAASICLSESTGNSSIPQQMLLRLAEAHRQLVQQYEIQQCECHKEEKIFMAEKIDILQSNLGNLFVCYGDYDSAISELQNSLRLLKGASDELSTMNKTATLLHNLGNCYLEVGKIRDAIPVLEEALKLSRALRGYENTDIADTAYTLAQAYEIDSNIDESISLLQVAIKARMEYFGMESAQVVRILQAMGKVLVAADRGDGALKVCQDALRIQKSLDHRRHGSLCSTTHFLMAQACVLNNRLEQGLHHFKNFIENPRRSSSLDLSRPITFYEIGNIYAARGEISLAEKCYERSRNEIEEQLGFAPLSEDGQYQKKLCEDKGFLTGQRIQFADIILLYGRLFRRDKHYENALVCVNIALDVFRVNLRESSLRTGNALYEKGIILSNLRDYLNAAIALRESLLIRKKIFLEKSQFIIETSRQLGICESKLGNHNVAMDLLKQNMFRKVSKTKTEHDIKTLMMVGKLYYEKNELNSALKYYGRCLHLIQQMKKEDTEKSFVEVTMAVGDALFKSGNHFRALMSFEQALSAASCDSVLICEALIGMGNYFVELDRYDDAVISYQTALDQLQAKYGLDHESTSQALICLGNVFSLQQHFEASKNSYEKAVQVLRKNFGAFNDGVSMCWFRIGDVLVKEGKIKEALGAYLKSFSIMKSIGREETDIWNIYYKTGKCLLILRRYSEAASNLLHALQVAPKSSKSPDLVDARLLLASAQLGIEDSESALMNFTQATDDKIPILGSEKEAAELEKTINTVLIILEKSKGRQNLEYANFMQKRAICQAFRKNHRAAISSYSRAFQIFKKIHCSSHTSVKNSLFNIAICLNSLGNPARARKYLEKAYDMAVKEGSDGTELADILFNKGISYKLEKNYRASKKCFEEAIQMKTNSPEYESESTAEIFELVGDTMIENKEMHALESVNRYYSEGLRLYIHLCCHQKAATIQYKLAKLHTSAKNHFKAISHFEKSLATNKVLFGGKGDSIAELYFNLGIAHDRVNSIKKAILCFELCTGCGNPTYLSKALTCKGRSLSKTARYNEALECFSKALEEPTVEPKEEADTLVAKGQVLGIMGREEEAITFYCAALAVYRTIPDSNEKISSTCQEIANHHLRQGHLDDAHKFVKEALEIRQTTSGTHHLLTGESLFSRGSILFGQMEYEQSLSCLQLALYIFNMTGGSQLMKANSLYMIGCIQEKLERFDHAILSLRDSLELRKGMGALNHIDGGRTLRMIGTVHLSRGEYSHARLSLKESLEISTNQLGPQHEEIAQIYKSLADTCNRELKLDDAEYYINESIEILETYGESFELSHCYGLKGVILDNAGDIKGAVTSFEQSKSTFALLLRKTIEGDQPAEFLSYADITFKLGTILERMGNVNSASRNYSKSVKLYKVALKTNDNLQSAEAYERLANLRGRQEKYDKASILLEEVLRIRIAMLGMEHASVAQALYSLGIVFCKKHEADGALKAFTDCLSIQQLTLGADALETADTYHAIGQCLGNNGDFKNALSAWNRAYDIYAQHRSPKIKSVKQDLQLAYQLLEEG